MAVSQRDKMLQFEYQKQGGDMDAAGDLVLGAMFSRKKRAENSPPGKAAETCLLVSWVGEKFHKPQRREGALLPSIAVCLVCGGEEVEFKFQARLGLER